MHLAVHDGDGREAAAAEAPDRLDGEKAVRCLGCCGLAPVAVVNGEVHGKLETKDVEGIIEQYRKLG